MAQSNTIIIHLLDMLYETDATSPVNAKQVMERMESEYGLRPSRQMIYEQVQVLKECGYPVESCVRKNDGWYMAEHGFDDCQLKIMMDAVTQSRCISGEESVKINRQLLKMTSARGRRKLGSIYTPENNRKTDDKRIREYLDTIMEATLCGKKIEFNYTFLDRKMKRQERLQDGKPKLYELNVYTLQESGGNYYVIGGHDKYKPSLTHYRIDRMENIRISDKPITDKKAFLGDNPDYKIQNYLDLQVDHFAGEEKVRMTLEFTADNQNMDILSDFVGNDFHLRQTDDGKIRVTFRKDKTPTLMGWLLRYGSRFKIIEPESLRAEVCEEAGKILKMYGQQENETV